MNHDRSSRGPLESQQCLGAGDQRHMVMRCVHLMSDRTVASLGDWMHVCGLKEPSGVQFGTVRQSPIRVRWLK